MEHTGDRDEFLIMRKVALELGVRAEAERPDLL
jgi:hypothetical protein